MNILNYACRGVSWQPQLDVASRDAALEAILDVLCTEEFLSVNAELSKEGILQALVEREALRTTAVGNGIAFPHARLENLTRAIFAVATLKNPVQFGDQPVNIVCLTLVPVSDPSISLKLMAQFSRTLMDESTRKQVLEARDPKTLETLFAHEDASIDKPLIARDIMRLPRWSVNEDTSLSECAKMMSNYQLRAIPVLDENKHIVGEITADLLFRYGLPDFFARLKSVSFVAEFDPFEKYFQDERETPARAVMSHAPRIVKPEHTVMEIVFDLAVKNVNKLYVTDHKDRWIGTVTKGTILDNVINL